MTIPYTQGPLDQLEYISGEAPPDKPWGRPPSTRIQRRLAWQRMTGSAPGQHLPEHAVSQAARDWWRWFRSLDALAEQPSTGQITFF